MAQEFVENVLEVHRKYRTLIQDVFQGDQAFVGALDKACTAVINHRPPKQPAKAPELVRVICILDFPLAYQELASMRLVGFFYWNDVQTSLSMKDIHLSLKPYLKGVMGD